METTSQKTCACQHDTQFISTPYSSVLAISKAFAAQAQHLSQGRVLDQNETFHLNEGLLGFSANSAPVSGKEGRYSGTASAITSTAGLNVEIAEVKSGEWSAKLTYAPVGGGRREISFHYAVNGSSAKLVNTDVPPGDAKAGLDVMCLVSAGAGSILATVVSCLPALAGGPAVFAAALLAALGPTAVDLVQKIVACFG